MYEDKVVSFTHPEPVSIEDPLTQVLRSGVRRPRVRDLHPDAGMRCQSQLKIAHLGLEFVFPGAVLRVSGGQRSSAETRADIGRFGAAQGARRKLGREAWRCGRTRDRTLSNLAAARMETVQNRERPATDTGIEPVIPQGLIDGLKAPIVLQISVCILLPKRNKSLYLN